MPPLLTYSLLAICGAAFAFGLWLGGKSKPAWAKRWSRRAGVLQIAALVAAYLVLRPGGLPWASSATNSGISAMTAAREHNRPIFVDLYSNF